MSNPESKTTATERLSEIALAWRAVGDHAGIVVEAQGDDAAATWNRLCNLLDPLVRKESR